MEASPMEHVSKYSMPYFLAKLIASTFETGAEVPVAFF